MSIAISAVRSVAAMPVSERPLVSVEIVLAMLDVDSAERENEAPSRRVAVPRDQQR